MSEKNNSEDQESNATSPQETIQERIARKRHEADLEMDKNLREIKRQEYEKVKKEMERFRLEHGIKKSKEELEKEDEDLKKQYGIK